MNSRNKVARKALAGLIVTSTLGIGGALAPQVAVADLNTVSATTVLNVRQQPSTSSQILGVLSVGEQVERRGDPRGEWTPVTYRGQDAWVFSAYTSLGTVTSTPGATATATDNVNVRSGPSTLSSILGMLRVGESVTVTGDIRGGWAPVSYGGRDAFVYAAYLSIGSTTPDDSSDSGASTPDDQTTPTPPASGGSTPTGTARATTAVNVRSGPSTNDRILTVLATGQSIEVRGDAEGDWTPVIHNGQDAWVFSRYLTSADAPEAPKGSTAYTTTAVNLRTGPSTGYTIVRVLPTNTELKLTGTTQDGFSQVEDAGQLRWIASAYLSDSPVADDPSSGGVQGPLAPRPDGSTSLNTGGSSGLDQMRDTTKQVVYQIRQNFPQITTMYGVRPYDPYPDHPSGRAVDIMMPRGANDVELGNKIAAYLQANANALNIEYLIWRQQIWINGQGGWTWMADRGGITANHYDHVHVTVRY